MTRTLAKVPPHVSFRLTYLSQDKGVTGKELLSLYWQAVKSIDSA